MENYSIPYRYLKPLLMQYNCETLEELIVAFKNRKNKKKLHEITTLITF